MVEVSPGNHDQEDLFELEEEIFDSIDEEIREFHNWCRNLVEEITRRIKNLTKRNRDLAMKYREQI